MSEPRIHPAIMGLLQLIPPEGMSFPKETRETWLESLRCALDLIYEEEPQVEVEPGDE